MEWHQRARLHRRQDHGAQRHPRAYATGRGCIIVRACAEISEEKERPLQDHRHRAAYQVNKAKLIETIADMVKDKRIEGISNIEDHSDREGMQIVIDIKRDASPQIILNQLYTYTQMQTTFGVIMLAIVNGEPKILTLKEMLRNYIDFQVDVVTRRTIFELRKAEERALPFWRASKSPSILLTKSSLFCAPQVDCRGKTALRTASAWTTCRLRLSCKCASAS